MDTISDIPKPWRSALASIQTLYPSAVIAGGCLRDREAGVKVKDIDIFVPCDDTSIQHGRNVEHALKKDGWRDVKVIHDKTYNNSRISMSIETVFPGCPAINVVVAPYTLAEFDFGCCQIEFDGKRILRTRDYHIDVRHKVFRLIPKCTDSEFVRSLNRWARLKEKFPEWTLDLGSRAESRGVKWATGGPVVTPRMDNHFDKLFGRPTPVMTRKPMGYADLEELITKRGGEFVYPRAVAERISRELPQSTVKPHPHSTENFTVTVHPNEVTVVADIIRATIMENERRARDSYALMPAYGGRP